MKDVVLSSVTAGYGEKRVLDAFDLAFVGGEVTVVMGSSGVGKTTLLNVLAGLLPHTGEVSGAEGGVSYIFQKDRLIPQISVYKNLDLVLRAVERDKKKRRADIEEMLERAEILSEMEKRPTELSGGQALRVAMARAFLYPSEILLMDEPFRALDLGLKLRLMRVLGKLLSESPRTVVYITHDIDECLLAADRWVVLGGEPVSVVEEGRIDIPRGGRDLACPELASLRATLTRLLSE